MIMSVLPDKGEREEAITTFDRNVVVTAGAGTGKTSLLVERIIHLLFSPSSPLNESEDREKKITRLVAITFTNKAANEVKVRLRNRLQSLLVNRPESEGEKGFTSISILRDRYGFTMNEIRRIAEEAITHLEKTQICTIHSFAAHILRLYPLEAGVQPDFKEDEGQEFSNFFEQEWREWLDKELSRNSPRQEIWKEVLMTVDLAALREFAREMCKEAFPLENLLMNHDKELKIWLKERKDRAKELLNKYGGLRKTNIMRGLAKSIDIFEALLKDLDVFLTPFNPGQLKAPGSWDEEDYQEARGIIKSAEALTSTNIRIIETIKDLLSSFARDWRKKFILSGNISFDGLLVYCRNLLRDNRRVREELKRKYRVILLDEFQDTDPLQYEIVFYLAEDYNRYDKDWRNVRLMPGKLFIVGDPKQSIYSFRKADIEAYTQVTRIIKTDGIERTLSTNFRSNKEIIDVVNSIFSRLIKDKGPFQPPYKPIDEYPGRETSFPLQGVEIRLIEIDGTTHGNLDADQSTRIEAETLCRWLKEDVVGQNNISWGDIALLLRTLTRVNEYLSAFRRYDIPYIVEGEKHFYTNQEIIDFVNLLRIIDNPSDHAAMVGFLRSPIGALSDREIYELNRLGLLDYTLGEEDIKRRLIQGLEDTEQFSGVNDIFPSGYMRRPVDLVEHIITLYGELKKINSVAGKLPVSDAIDYILESLPVLDVAAYSFQGEQAVANIMKIQRIADSLHNRGNMTLKGFIIFLEKKVRDMEEEGEHSLAEEGIDAVKVMSIHKAKGLEFPMVILAGMHTGTGKKNDTFKIYYEWWESRVGISLKGLEDHMFIMLKEKMKLREEEERKRLLYVAMTRAKDYLVLSGTLYKNSMRKETYLGTLKEVLGSYPGGIDEDLGRKEKEEIYLDRGVIHQTIVNPPVEWKPHRRTDMKGGLHKRKTPAMEESLTLVYPDDFMQRWNEREERYKKTGEKELFISPSRIESEMEEKMVDTINKYPGYGVRYTRYQDLRKKRRGHDGNDPEIVPYGDGTVIGIIIHRVLQEWDFKRGPHDITDIDGLIDRWARGFHIPELAANMEAVKKEIREILESFISSSAYEELKQAEILAREIPFIMPWGDQVMEGIIDLIYKTSEGIYVADYKTDRVPEETLEKRVERYRESAHIYLNAVKRSLGAQVKGFRFIFIRHGKILPSGSGRTELSS